LPGTLYVVATPIGNLEDITLRALRVLREVHVIAAEDTRRTAKLLSHYSIATPTTSLHEHNEISKAGRLVEQLRSGKDIALVSDAGTPLVSDPGAHLVTSAREAGILVVAVPGASALLTALAASGLAADAFVFLGFPPRRAIALKAWVGAHLTPPHPTVVFYEAPHRVRRTLETMLSLLGERQIFVGRELTKIHEQLVKSPISTHIATSDDPRGEFTVIVPSAQAPVSTAVTDISGTQLEFEIGQLMDNEGITRREAARRVARRWGLSANDVYRRAGPSG
jgi:16S rRNA (cytidine1402-2'-O)-methyltransferase